MLASTVSKQSNSGAAMASNLPFVTPDQPISTTVTTSWPGSSLRSRLGTHSSSNTRIGESQISSLLKGGYSHFARDAREAFQEFVQRFPRLEEVQQRLEGHSRARKARCATHYVWNAEDDGLHGADNNWLWIPRQITTLSAHNGRVQRPRADLSARGRSAVRHAGR
jgi:hypothetical protein